MTRTTRAQEIALQDEMEVRLRELPLRQRFRLSRQRPGVEPPAPLGLAEGARPRADADAGDDPEGTMRGTLVTVSTRDVAPVRRRGLRRFRNASGLIGIIAAAALALGVAAVRPAPATLAAVAASSAPAPSPSSRAPDPVEEAEAPRAARVAPLAAASTSTPVPLASSPPMHGRSGRTDRAPAPAPAASAPPSSAPFKVDLGDNGAPILP